jgi:Zn-dependent protease with chaperone function
MMFGASDYGLLLAPIWLLTVVLFAGIAIWLGLHLALRPFKRCKSDNWMERARLAYPGWSLFMTGPALLVVIFLFSTPAEVEFENETARRSLNLMVLVAVLTGTAFPSSHWATRLRGRPASVRDYWRSLGQTFLLLAPQITVFLLMLFALPSRFDLRALVIIGAFVAVAVLLAFGGNLRISQWLGLLMPASERLLGAMEEATRRQGHRPVAVYSIPTTAANAYAFPFSGVVGVTTAALDELNDEELIAVCVHELSHLTEPRPVTAVRLAGSFAMLPFFLMLPAFGTFGLHGLLGAPVLTVLIVWITRRVARKMEERADKAGKAHEGDPGIYARALEKLYRSNLMPAVMGQKRPVHPHLYDRMIEAGVTPEYSRPKPPSKAMSLFAHGIVAVVAVIFAWGARTLLSSLQ